MALTTRETFVNAQSFFRKLLCTLYQILPCSIREDKKTLLCMCEWYLIGLSLRLLLMPIAANGDLVSTYHRSYLLLIGDYSQPTLLLKFVQIIQAFFLILYSPVLPLHDLLYWEGSLSVSRSFFFDVFLSSPYCHTALFLFKLPYLMFDFGCSILLLHILQGEKNLMLAHKFWAVNPIGIFATYVFAKYEVVPIFFLLVSLYCAKQGKGLLSLFSLAIAAYDRIYPLAFLPAYLFVIGKNLRERFVLLLVGLSLFILEGLAFKSVLPGSARGFYELWLMELLSTQLETGLPGYPMKIHIFVLAYVLLTLYWLHSPRRGFDELWRFALAALLVYYATAFFNPQYFAWLTPFIALAISKYKTLIKLHLLQIICFIFYTFQWGKGLAGYLFASINPSFFTAIPSPAELINQFYSSEVVISLFRTILSATCAYMLLIISGQRHSDH